ncbi:MAG: hypothetical protein WKF77_19975 [Planctomycetaceae bacterium]
MTATTGVHQGVYPVNVLSSSGGNFQVSIRGTTTLDVRTIDSNTLFIGDARDATGGRVLSIRFTDINGDGIRDAIVTVQNRVSRNRSVIHDDTSSLRITFSTRDGTQYDGTRAVETTELGPIRYWMADHGRQWLRFFLQYLRTERRYW